MSDSYSGSEKYGDTTGTVTLIYEDASGKEFREEYYFELTIGSPIINAPTHVSEKETEEKEEAEASQWWISVGVLLAAIIALASILLYRRRHTRL